MSLTQQQLEQVNAQRLGETYKDTDAAEELTGTASKAPLTESPFLVLFDYGKAKSGYWGYKHIICQLEDCVDVLRVLFPGDNGDKFAYDFVFEFDWSAGHSRNRPDGLTVGGSTNLGFEECSPSCATPPSPMLLQSSDLAKKEFSKLATCSSMVFKGR